MQPLEKHLRNALESPVKQARDVAEGAVRAALEQLGVGESVAYKHFNDDQRQLRRKLRVRGRQKGIPSMVARFKPWIGSSSK